MPTFIQEAETSWSTTTSPKVTAPFDVVTDDLLVAVSGTTSNTVAMVASDSAGSSWTVQDEVNVAGQSRATIATAALLAGVSGLTVTFTASGSGQFCGGNALTFRDGEPGAFNHDQTIIGIPSVSLTTTRANSAIVVFIVDESGRDGSARVWLTAAGPLTELTYFTDGNWTIYVGYHADAGAIASRTVGLSAPGSQRYSIVALEVKDVPIPPPPEQTGIITLTAAE
jgi:hypothetical protein